MTLSEIKSALVQSHRDRDWSKAAELSQLKEKAKKVRFCLWPGCGVRLSWNRTNSPKEHCYMHSVMNRYKRGIVAVLCVSVGLAYAAESAFTTEQVITVQSNSAFAYFSFPSLAPNFFHYSLYYGTASSNYTTVINTGSLTNYTVTNLETGLTYYWNVTQVSRNKK